jgi:hypothetical protein
MRRTADKRFVSGKASPIGEAFKLRTVLGEWSYECETSAPPARHCRIAKQTWFCLCMLIQSLYRDVARIPCACKCLLTAEVTRNVLAATIRKQVSLLSSNTGIIKLHTLGNQCASIYHPYRIEKTRVLCHCCIPSSRVSLLTLACT